MGPGSDQKGAGGAESVQSTDRPENRHLPSFANLLRFVQVAVGKGLWAVLGLAVSAILARRLLPADFGLYSLSVAVSVVVLELVGSEGIDNSLVRFGARELSRESDQVAPVFRLALFYKIVLVLIVLPLGVLLARPIALRLIEKPEAVEAIAFGVVIGGGMSLWRYFLAVLQSGQRFAHYAWLQLLPNLLKLLGVLGLIALASLTLRAALEVSLGVYVAGIATGTLLCWKVLTPRNTTSQPSVRREFASFVGWLIIVNLLAALCSRVDILMMSYYLTSADVGVYSAALLLASGLDLVYTSWMVFLFPTVSALQTQDEFKAFYHQALKYSVILAAMVAPLLVLAGPLIRLVFSAEFLDAVLPFRILLVGLMLTMSLNPLLLFIYARARPQGMVVINALSLVVAVAGHAWAMPRFGMVGAAAVTCATRALTAFSIAFLSSRLIRAPQEQHH